MVENQNEESARCDLCGSLSPEWSHAVQHGAPWFVCAECHAYLVNDLPDALARHAMARFTERVPGLTGTEIFADVAAVYRETQRIFLARRTGGYRRLDDWAHSWLGPSC